MAAIDSAWFYQKLADKGVSLRDMARFMRLDPSAVSRMLNGERKMSADEQDAIAAYLEVSLIETAARRGGKVVDFEENGQEAYLSMPIDKTDAAVAGDLVTDGDPEVGMSFYQRVRGCMKGTVSIPPETDLAAPTDPEWARVYDDD